MMLDAPTHRMTIDGEEIALTAAEVAAWRAEQEALSSSVAPDSPQGRVIHMAWVKAAVEALGHKLRIEHYLSGLPDPSGPIMRNLWEYATEVDESNRLIVSVAQACGIDHKLVFRTAFDMRRATLGA